MRRFISLLLILSIFSLSTVVLAQNYGQSPFLIPESIPSVEELYAGEDVTIKITFEEGPGADSLESSILSFETGLASPISWTVQLLDKDDNPVETISKSSSEFTLEVKHQNFEKMSVVLSGKAPAVQKRTQITFAKILQTVSDGGNSQTLKVLDLKAYVTNADISDALNAISEAESEIARAEDAIEEAKDAGADVSMAESKLNDAKNLLKSAQNLYNAGNAAGAYLTAKSAVDAAKEAYEYANDAKEKAEATSFRNKLIIYGAIGAIALIVIIALIMRYRGGFERL
ncbi:MAG: hypothetical protein H5T46_04050 [Archaeoglobi archaeon]|nr:hypothetical protein [Candidatus Mnemosynella sp.]